MRIIKISLISLAAIGLSACTTVSDRYGFFKDEAQSYKKTNYEERAVVIPQNLSSRNVEDYYEVPQPSADMSEAQPSMTPPGSNLTPRGALSPMALSQQERIRNAESAKIQGHTNPMDGVSRPVGVNFSQAWVKVGHILQASNYKVVEKDKALGTYYVIDTSTTGGKVKKDMPIYQVNLKPSGNGTRVTVSPSNPVLNKRLYSSLND